MSEFWRAQLACPQCGGRVELDVGDPVLACAFCRTGLYLVSPGPLCYRLPPAKERLGAAPLVYLPFWRFRGLRYRVTADPPQVDGGLLDATVPALAALPSGANLGVRPQVSPLAMDLGGAPAVAPDRSAAAAVEAAEGAVESLHAGRALFTRLIGETVALVLAPHTIEERAAGWMLQEALRDGAVYPLTEAQAQALRSEPATQAGRTTGRIAFLPLRCPECGHGLPASPGAAALLCGHCTRAWWVRGGALVPMPYAARRAQQRGARYFPFWELAFRATGLPAQSRAELRRWVVSYQPAPEGWDRQSCLLLVPGFKLQPRTFLRLARVLSLASLDVPPSPHLFGEPFEAEPVRLPLAEAAQALKVVLAQLVAGRPRELARVADVELRVKRARLLYLPFHRRRDEWVEEATGTALQTAAVEHGARL